MDLVKIFRANNNIEADIIKSFLESHDINALIQGKHHRSLLGLVGPYVGLDIMVSEENKEKAEELIEEYIETNKKDFEKSKKKVNEFPQTLRRTNKKIAFMLALMFPGLGTCYTGRTDIGAWIIFLLIVCDIIALGVILDMPDIAILAYVGLVVIDIVTSFNEINKARKLVDGR